MADDGAADTSKAAVEDLPVATTLYLNVLDETIAEMEAALEDMRAARGHLLRFGSGGDLAGLVSKFAPARKPQ